MNTKKITSLLLAGVMSVSLLVGCSNNASNNESKESSKAVEESSKATSAEVTSSEVTSAEVTSSEESVDVGWDYTSVKLDNPNLTIALHNNNSEYVKKAIAMFEEKYGGKVTVIETGWNKIASTIQEGLTTGNYIDLAFIEGFKRVPGDFVDGLYQPIDQYLNYEVCDQVSLDAYLFKDQYYVFTNAMISQVCCIYYNKTLFEEEGLETPRDLFERGAWTQDKFLEYLEYFTRDTDGDGVVDQFGLTPRYKLQHFATANGANIVYEVGNGTLATGIDSEEVRQHYEFTAKFSQIYQKASGDSLWLETRNCAMHMEAFGATTVPFETTDEIDIVPIPTYSGELASTPLWDNGYAIPASASNPEAAAVLANMICQVHMEDLRKVLQENWSEEINSMYDLMMSYAVPQRRVYTGVTVGAGENEAKAGTPAQTILETYKSQVEAEVANYNATVIGAK